MWVLVVCVCVCVLVLHDKMCNVVKIKSCPPLVAFGVLCTSMRVCPSMCACVCVCVCVPYVLPSVTTRRRIVWTLLCPALTEGAVFNQASESLKTEWGEKKCVFVFVCVCVCACACALTTVVSARAVPGMCVWLAAYRCVYLPQ